MSMEMMMDQAVKLYATGHLDEAEQLFRQILDNDPTSGQALYFLGIIALGKGIAQEALDFLYKAKELYPSNNDYKYSLGVALQEAGHPEEALDIYKHLQTMPEAQNNMGNIYRAKGEMQKALAAFDKALELKPLMEWALVNKALLYRDLGKMKEAEFLLQEAVKAHENFAEGWYQLGVQKRLEGDLKQSVLYFEKALSLNTLFAPIWNSYGIALEALGQYEDAFNAYTRAIDLNRFSDEAYFNKGHVLEAMKRPDEAEKAYRDAIRVNPNFIEAYHNLGTLLYHQGRLNEALETYREVFIINPSYTQSQFNLAIVLEELEEYQEAAGLYFNVLAKQAFESEVHVRLSALLPKWFIKDKKEALHYAKAWVQHFPDNVFAKHTLYALEGKTDDDTLLQYTRQFYDAFAESYDAKMAELTCSVPQLIDEKIKDKKFKNALELGCGTGACGVYLRPVCTHLTGIDLSEKMLEKAKQTQKYDTLLVKDALEYLKKTKKKYDLIVAADVLCYMGDLKDLFEEVRKKLASKGTFLFTIEETKGKKEIEMNPFGRYLHSSAYVKSLLQKTGFQNILIEEVPLRKEGLSKAAGLLVTAS